MELPIVRDGTSCWHHYLASAKNGVGKVIGGAGIWAARYSQVDSAGFGLVLEGECYLKPDQGPCLRLAKGDFVLLPPNPGFVISSHPGVQPVLITPIPGITQMSYGSSASLPQFRLLGGYFRFEPGNDRFLSQLFPSVVHIKASDVAAGRLAGTIRQVAEEALSERPGRDLIVERLVEVMLVEALRFPQHVAATYEPGLLSGLSDTNVAAALRSIHALPARRWTLPELARLAGLSRTTFSLRFKQRVGIPPMEYVGRWRMAIARGMLQHDGATLDKVAASIGYESASAFSTAFRKQHGRPPRRFTSEVQSQTEPTTAR